MLPRLLLLSLCLSGGFFAVLFFEKFNRKNQKALIQLWSRSLLWALGVRLQVAGTAPREPCLIVANHISWLDVVAMAAMHPAAFVGKSEIAAWPGIGFLLRRIGTVFIRRASFRDILRVNEELRGRFAAGRSVAVYPEGTTTDGTGVLPFKPALFQPAVERGLPVHPVALAYSDPAAHFLGDTSFAASLLAIAGARNLEVRVTLLPPVSGALTRKVAASGARAAVAAAALPGITSPQPSSPPAFLPAASSS